MYYYVSVNFKRSHQPRPVALGKLSNPCQPGKDFGQMPRGWPGGAMATDTLADIK